MYFINNLGNLYSLKIVNDTVNKLIEATTTFLATEIMDSIIIINDNTKAVSTVKIDGEFIDDFLMILYKNDYVDAMEYLSIPNDKISTSGCDPEEAFSELIIDYRNTCADDAVKENVKYIDIVYCVCYTNIEDGWMVSGGPYELTEKHLFKFSSWQSADKWMRRVKYLLNKITI